jgi:serine/threonine protein kinase
MHSDVEIDLTKYLGGGSPGTVFKCKFLCVPAAAKVFDGTDTQLVKAVEAEANFLASLQHPNVVRFIEYAIKATQRILVSELMSMDLFKYLKEQRVNRESLLSLLVAINIMLQIGRAMDYLHHKKV